MIWIYFLWGHETPGTNNLTTRTDPGLAPFPSLTFLDNWILTLTLIHPGKKKLCIIVEDEPCTFFKKGFVRVFFLKRNNLRFE